MAPVPTIPIFVGSAGGRNRASASDTSDPFSSRIPSFSTSPQAGTPFASIRAAADLLEAHQLLAPVPAPAP